MQHLDPLSVTQPTLGPIMAHHGGIDFQLIGPLLWEKRSRLGWRLTFFLPSTGRNRLWQSMHASLMGLKRLGRQ
jgi:hypothetical protein